MSEPRPTRFGVTDLTGIEHCTGLQSIDGLFGAVDVARLASLSKLREVVLGGVIENLERQAKSKSLERVVWGGSTPLPEIARETLEKARLVGKHDDRAVSATFGVDRTC